MSSTIDSSYYSSTYYTLLQTITTNEDGSTSVSETVTDDTSTSSSTTSADSTASLLDSLMGDTSSYWSGDSDTTYFSGMALELANLQVQSAYGSYSSTSTSSATTSLDYLGSLATSAAEDLGLSSVTFQDLIDHKEYLLDNLASTVSEGLAEAGVAEDADFRVSIDENGSIVVQSNHADADAIQAYFDTNTSLSDIYKQIDALDQIENSRASNTNSTFSLSSTFSLGMQTALSSSMATGYATQASTLAFTDGGASVELLAISGISTTA